MTGKDAPVFEPSLAVQRNAASSERPAGRPGPGVISLASGDPDFATPDYIRQALIDALAAGYTHYADSQGDPELRAALASIASASAGTTITPEQVLVTHGGSAALTSAIVGVVNPGERVLIPEPTYSLYADLTRMVGAEPVFVPQTSDFHLDLDAIDAEAAKGAILLVVCHPCNPTGVIYRDDELQALGRLAGQYDFHVLADEAYDHIVFGGASFTSTLAIEELRERLIYCQTFSKTYAMTGWRLGYLIASAPVTAAAARIHRTLIGPMNSALQRAALAAVTTESDWPERMRVEYEARRELVMELMADVPGLSIRPPDGAFYAFIHYDGDTPPRDVVSAAMEQGVAIRGGTEYGPSGAGYVRIAFATDRKRLTDGLLRLRSVLTSLSS
jgi:aspartate aminotransferase